MMNLILPLKNPDAFGRAPSPLAFAKNVDEIFDGLDNMGTCTLARLMLLRDTIYLISAYSGDLGNDIRDFMETTGSVFDDVITLM